MIFFSWGYGERGLILFHFQQFPNIVTFWGTRRGWDFNISFCKGDTQSIQSPMLGGARVYQASDERLQLMMMILHIILDLLFISYRKEFLINSNRKEFLIKHKKTDPYKNTKNRYIQKLSEDCSGLPAQCGKSHIWPHPHWTWFSNVI